MKIKSFVRARFWLRHCGFNEDSMSTVSNTSNEDKKIEEAQKEIQAVNGALKFRMFFC